MRITFVLILFTLTISHTLIAQTPPARTWFYNSNGTKTEVKERWYEDSDGLKHGKYILYGISEVGYIYHVEEVGNYNHGKMEGIWKNFYPNGSIFSIGSYKNDGKVGYWKEVEKNGVFQEGNYLNGVRDGEWKNTFYYKYFGYDMLGRERWQEKIETKLNCKTIYKNGEVMAAYDDKGVNQIEKAKQEVENKIEEDEFKKCATKSEFENFRKKYPNSEWGSDAIIQIVKFESEEKKVALNKKKEDDYLNPLLTKWKSLPDTSKTATFFNEYLNQFPNGYRKVEVKNETNKIWNLYDDALNRYKNESESLEMSKEIQYFQYTNNGITLNNTTDNLGIFNDFFQKYPKVETEELDEWLKNKIKDKPKQYQCQIETLIKLNTDESLKTALAMLNVINRYSSSLHSSWGMPFSIQRVLVNWKLGNIETTIQEVEFHKNSIVEYSSGSIKYSKSLKQYYKDYKIGYPDEKEVWKRISEIFN